LSFDYTSGLPILACKSMKKGATNAQGYEDTHFVLTNWLNFWDS